MKAQKISILLLIKRDLIGSVFAFVGLFLSIPPAQSIDQPKTKWRYKTQGPIRGSSIVFENGVYFGSADGAIYALDLANGSLKWKYQTRGSIAGAPAVTNNAVYGTGRDDTAYAIDRSTGKLLWEFEMEPATIERTVWEYYTASPVVASQGLLVPSANGSLYSIDAYSGKLRWKFETEGRLRATPLVANKVIYQPSFDGYVYALSEKTGELLWKFEIHGVTEKRRPFVRKAIFTEPILRDNLLIFGARDSRVYAVDINTHEKVWSFRYENDNTWVMAVNADDDTVYVGWSTNNKQCALDLNTGQQKWERIVDSHSYATPLPVEEAVYFGSANGNLYCLDKATGEAKWAYELNDEIYSAPIQNADTILVGCDNGFFYAIENGELPQKAVYQPSETKGNFSVFNKDAKITRHLIDKGFAQISSPSGLQEFIQNRIDDSKPSVVVFAHTYIPNHLMGENPATGLIRQYLDTGGKIVWLDGPPNQFLFNEEGTFEKRDLSIPSRLLDMEFSKSIDNATYRSEATREGLNWGMPLWIKSGYLSGIPQEGLIPFCKDEYGRIGAWMKTFNDRLGSGFIAITAQPPNTPIRNKDLELIHSFAVHGLE